MSESAVQPTAATNVDAPARSSGSSFYLAMRLLPKPKRDAMFEIYAFCRAVDDIADGEGPRPHRRKELQRWRADIDALFGNAAPVRLAGLAAAVRRFDLQRADFLAVIDGMEMDLEQDIRAPDMATLDLYCDRVASAVGRLSVRVFGMEPGAGLQLAHHLGRALQLTNILRDLDEDAGVGRLYLPLEALKAAGIASNEPQRVLSDAALGRACAPVVEQARAHFTEAFRIMVEAPRATVRAPRLMGEAYRRILDRLVARGWAAPRARVRLSRLNLLWVVLRDSIF